jgi:hypothetical protein
MKPLNYFLFLIVLGSLWLVGANLAGDVMGETAPSTGAEEAVSWPSQLFLVRPEGAKGPLVAYDMADGRQRFKLPAGLLSADEAHYFTAVLEGESTSIQAYDVTTGRLRESWTVNGRWALQSISAAGQWLALRRVVPAGLQQFWAITNQWQTEMQIVDTTSGQTSHTFTLDGNFEVETISVAGDGLFLIQHLPAANPDHYLVRFYDPEVGDLWEAPLRDKRFTDQVMAGLAWSGIGSPDGQWLLTLYLNTQRNVAFIHTLNLVDRYPVCIDLPSGAGDFELLKYYTVALAGDGRTVFAVNPALGVVVEVSLETFEVVHTTEFTAYKGIELDAPLSQSVLSDDGRWLYFTDGRSAWLYDVKTREVSGPLVTDQSIEGLGVSEDGQRLYVARAGQPVMVVDTASGQVLP